MSMTHTLQPWIRCSTVAAGCFLAGSCAIYTAPFESIPANEASEIEQTAALTVVLQDMRAKNDENQKNQLLRGVHAKSHGCVVADFVVRDDLEEKYRVGLLAHPGKRYKSWIRFSNASVLREDDLKAKDKNDPKTRQNGSRGMAIKVMEVDGEMSSQDDGQGNQDFLMINTPEFAIANVHDYLRLNRILQRSPKGDDPQAYFIPAKLNYLGPPKEGEPAATTKTRAFLQQLVSKDPLLNMLSKEDLAGTISSDQVATKIVDTSVRNPMQVQYFGAAPFLFGNNRAMKFSAAPCTIVEQLPFKDITEDNPSKNYLLESLSQSMKGPEDICYNFKIQVRGIDSDNLNIENATTTWPDEMTNYVNVARIDIKVPQSPDMPQAIEDCEKLAFSPWHSLADHRPLGGINRLRRTVYSDSAEHRGAEGY